MFPLHFILCANRADPMEKGLPMLTDTKKGLLNWIRARPSSRDRRRWHRATSAAPVRLRDGSLSTPGAGQLWRREGEGGWEYEQDDGFEEPDDDLD